MTGKERAKQVYKNLKPGNKSVFINMEAIEALPDEFDVIIKDIAFDPQNLEKSFSNVGTKNNPSWYPRTELMYDIAEARGVLGYGEKTIETIKDEVDINPMLMKPMEDNPTMRIMEIAVRVTKQSRVLCEDGTYRPSSQCTNEFNFWDRAVLDWLNDEKYNNKKYSSPLLRKLRYMELKKFGLSQAETKAFVKTVRELAGLPTGFTTGDLQTGKLTLFKIVRSKSIIKLETAARIDAIRGGKTKEIESNIQEVFEGEMIEAPKITHVEDIPVDNIEMKSIKPETLPEIKELKDIPEPTTQKKHFQDMTYPEKKEYLKTVQYAECGEDKRREYVRDVMIAYQDKEGENRSLLEKINNAIPAIEGKIINWQTVSIDDNIKFIKKIENQQGIKKLEHTLPV